MNNTMIKWVWATVSFFAVYWSTTLVVSASDSKSVTLIPKGMQQALTNLYREFYIFVNGFIAFGLLTGILAFIVLFLQLGSSGNAHPMARAFILRELLVVGISTALLGGFPLIIVLYLNMYQ